MFFNAHGVGEALVDLETDSVAELTVNTAGNLTSVLTFNSLEARVHNNTVVECSTFDGDRSNFTFIMAGIYGPLYT